MGGIQLLQRVMLDRLEARRGALAYICDEGCWSGRALAAAARRFATWLHCEGICAPVRLYGHKQLCRPAWMLGCMLAGVPYVPVDTGTPPGRMREVLRLSEAELAICAQAEDLPVRTLLPDALQHIFDSGEEAPLPTVDASATCYMLFTSGTSGHPKGVCISYANLAAFLEWVDAQEAVRASGRGPVLNQASFAFDLSVADLHYALYSGRCEVVLEQAAQQDFSVLFRRLAKSGAALAVMTPSFAQYCLLDKLFSAQLLPQLRCIFFCGEALPARTARVLQQRFPRLHILNAYGPTETTVAVCAAEITPELAAGDALPIAEGDAPLCLVDEALRPVPAGEVGEILIIGPAVGHYLDGPEGGFIEWAGVPAYRTGDLAVWREGLLWFQGRRDSQCKRGGHRIELLDIEANLRALSAVEACAVLCTGQGTALRIIAFVKACKAPEALLADLRKRLPAYMLPDRIVQVEEIPLNANAKTDYKALERSLLP